MRVLLINPPSSHMIRESMPPVVGDTPGTLPPLGLLYVAAYAEQVPDCSVSVLDCQAEGLDHGALPERIRAADPDVVGVQVMTFTLIDAAMVAGAVRRAKPSARIVFGGPHTTIYPRETVAHPDVDAVVVGEGEFPFANLLARLRDGAPLGGLAGVVTKETPADDESSCSLRYIEDLDTLRMPALHLVDAGKYRSPMARHRRVTTMMSSRGCPAKCIFCDRPQMGKVFRRRSAENVFAEMRDRVERHGVGEIIFYDDTFTVNRQRVLDICDLLTTSGLKVHWDIRARIDTMTPDMIDRLGRAGCARIHYGVETGSPRLQKLLRKNLDLGKVREVFAATRKAGIETLGYFMIGLPSETRDDLRQTADLMLSLSMDYAHVAVFTPYPGTEIYRQALSQGVYADDYWRAFALNPSPDFVPRYWTENFSEEELFATMKELYRKFYRRPGYLLHRLMKVRSVGELARKASVGIKLLSGTR